MKIGDSYNKYSYLDDELFSQGGSFLKFEDDETFSIAHKSNRLDWRSEFNTII